MTAAPTPAQALSRATCALFVPGDRPERFDKAAATGALVVVDLEDAVAPAAKAQARENVRRWLADGVRAAVRINAVGTPWHADDLAMVSTVECVVMVAKAEAATLPAVVGALPPASAVVALVETAAGIRDAHQIAATDGVGRLAFGSYDLAAELGVDPVHRPALDPYRSTLVLASAAAGLPAPLDGVTGAVGDEALLADDTRHARALGFGGRLCIHPRQVPVVAAGFAPTAAELEWARRVMAVVGAGGVSTLDGQMVDAPVAQRARRLLALAGVGDD